MTKSSKEPPSAPNMVGSQWDSVDGCELLEYNAESETYRSSFDCDSRSVTTAIILTVAAVAEKHPQELPPLYSVIDPDALEALVKSNAATPSQNEIHISFFLQGYEVTVHSYGIIAVEPPTNNSATEQ